MKSISGKVDKHFIFRKSDMLPRGVKMPVIFFFSASQQQRTKADFMIPRFTGSLMRATALSCLCGIKAGSISAAVRGRGALGGSTATVQLITVFIH